MMVESNNDNLALEIKGLTKYYGEIRGIENVNLQVEKGKIHGFLGPNGAGKTTAIRILVGLMKATSGTATILGNAAGSLEAKNKIGYLPSDFGLYSHYTVQEYLDFLANLRGGAPLMDELIERFNVQTNRKTAELSRGNKQKVAIVQAFMHKPELLIADEPTTGLDPLMQAEFNKFLFEFVKKGHTAFISSHILAEVQEIADQVTVIREGSIVKTGTVNQLLEGTPRKAILNIKNFNDGENLAKSLDARLGSIMADKVTLYFDYPVSEFVSKLDSIKDLETFSIPEPSLEEYFLSLYRKESVEG